MKTGFLMTTVLTAVMLVAGCASLRCRQQFVVPPEQCAIVLPENPSKAQALAARELAYHLKLITGQDISVEQSRVPEGRYLFHIGFIPECDKQAFESNEARYICREDGSWLYGDAESGHRGDLFAVYQFLEDQFNIHWIEPGEGGVVFKQADKLTMRKRSNSWKPVLGFANIRGGRPNTENVPANETMKYQNLPANHFLKCFEKLSLHDHNAIAQWNGDLFSWRLNRMRMGGLDRPSHGHQNYAELWKLYNKTRPEIFALNKWGKREPETFRKEPENYEFTQRDIQFIKCCTTSPTLIKMLIDEWAKRKDKYINACQNDLGVGYCRCRNCLALDADPDGGKQEGNLINVTDRYVHFANTLQCEARKIRPDVRACMYAYNETMLPPKHTKVDPGVIVGMVPTRIDSQFSDLIASWRRMGADTFTIRPNFHGVYLSYILPMGLEKQFYDTFIYALKSGVVAADYDSYMQRNLNNTLTSYILARAMIHPDKSFDTLLDEFCSAYGNAAKDVKAYYTYWRENIFEKKILPDFTRLVDKGGADNLGRAVRREVGEIYSISDFDATEAYLESAVKKSLEPREKERLDFLKLNHRHARLAFEAMIAPESARLEAARRLQEFRMNHLLKLTGVMGNIWTEVSDGDLTSIRISEAFKDVNKAVRTPLYWNFKILTENENVAAYASAAFSKWPKIPTDRAWEQIDEDDQIVSSALRDKLKTFDGLGCYALDLEIPSDMINAKELHLYFGAVDESCEIFVNGKKAGEHLFLDRNDWKRPFWINITPFIDTSSAKQDVVVKVSDNFGAGGVWRRIWLVEK